jgi:hypothetical protein
MPRKATRIGVDSSKRILSELWIINRTSKVTVKENKTVCTWVGQSPATTQSLRSRAQEARLETKSEDHGRLRVVTAFQSIYNR